MTRRHPIRLLDDLSIARIAAGEVVERPASVVKEVVENALDAGATRIDVRIDGGGLRRIEVADDGTGIAADEVALAFTRHATSKIASAGDLEHVSSLGFRGEALASIASVGHVTVVTRAAGAELGVRVRIDNGRLLGQEPTSAPVGTRLTVENLFNAVPARLKFQKSEATESGRVGEWLSHLAFAHPHVAFSLARGERTTFRTTGDGDRRAVLAAVLGDDVALELLEVVGTSGAAATGSAAGDGSDEAADGGPAAVRVTGFAGPPHVQRANRSGIALFVGGRWIQSARLTHAVVEAYHALMPAGRFPIAWLMIDVPPATVDVNVHPAKTEVRFRRENDVWHAVQQAVRGAVTGLAPLAPARPAHGPGARAASYGRPATPPPPSGGATAWPWAVSGGSFEGPAMATDRFAPVPRIADEPTATPPGGPPPTVHAPLPGAPTTAASAPPGTASAPHPALPPLRVVGHVAATYLVAEGPDGLYLIDQHAAHERVMYERLLARAASGGVAAQTLLEPRIVRLDAVQRAWVEGDGHADAVARVGLTLTLHREDAVAVHAVPEVLAGEDPAAVVRAVLDGATSDASIVALGLEARLVLAVCKRATVKAGQVLTEIEARQLVHDLERCAAPFACPHGRPTVIVWSYGRLEQMFGRV